MQLSDQLVSQVLALSPDARAELLGLLQASLPVPQAPGDRETDDLVAAEWTVELDRRIAVSRGGDPREVDAATALAEVRKQLAAGQGASGV